MLILFFKYQHLIKCRASTSLWNLKGEGTSEFWKKHFNTFYSETPPLGISFEGGFSKNGGNPSYPPIVLVLRWVLPFTKIKRQKKVALWNNKSYSPQKKCFYSITLKFTHQKSILRILFYILLHICLIIPFMPIKHGLYTICSPYHNPHRPFNHYNRIQRRR